MLPCNSYCCKVSVPVQFQGFCSNIDYRSSFISSQFQCFCVCVQLQAVCVSVQRRFSAEQLPRQLHERAVAPGAPAPGHPAAPAPVHGIRRQVDGVQSRFRAGVRVQQQRPLSEAIALTFLRIVVLDIKLWHCSSLEQCFAIQ